MRMNNDLISRYALKKAFDEYGEKAKFTQGACQQIIDNAPTIDPIFGLFNEPHGKWIKWDFKTFGAMGDWEYKCSNCEKVYDGEYNYCPNCGAKMDGGEDNEK